MAIGEVRRVHNGVTQKRDINKNNYILYYTKDENIKINIISVN